MLHLLLRYVTLIVYALHTVRLWEIVVRLVDGKLIQEHRDVWVQYTASSYRFIGLFERSCEAGKRVYFIDFSLLKFMNVHLSCT